MYYIFRAHTFSILFSHKSSSKDIITVTEIYFLTIHCSFSFVLHATCHLFHKCDMQRNIMNDTCTENGQSSLIMLSYWHSYHFHCVWQNTLYTNSMSNVENQYAFLLSCYLAEPWVFYWRLLCYQRRIKRTS